MTAVRAQAGEPFAGSPPTPHRPAGDVIITSGYAQNRITAIDLTMISQGYPLLWLSRHCGVTYSEMLNAYERWVDVGTDWPKQEWGPAAWASRWHTVLTEAFGVLSRGGILLHPSIEPLRRPAYPS